MWRKAMIQLGLGDDEDYDDGLANRAGQPGYEQSEDAPDDPGRAPDTQTGLQGPVVPPASTSAYGEESSAIGEVRPITSRLGGAREQPVGPGQTVNPSGGGAGFGGIRPRPQVVRPIPVPANAKPHVVVPASFNQAQDVADKFKGNQPVLMNLQGADRELSRRLIDFASGLCYGLGGQMERVTNQVYLLIPGNVEVSAEERRRLHERGYDA